MQSKAKRRESDAIQSCHWTISLLKRWLLGTHAGPVAPTSVVICHLAEGTKSILVGVVCIMLPNHAPTPRTLSFAQAGAGLSGVADALSTRLQASRRVLLRAA